MSRRQKHLVLFVGCILAVAVLAPATAQSAALAGACPGPPGGPLSANADQRFAETFTSSLSGRLVRGEIEIQKDAPGSSDWLVEVLATDGSGTPTNTALAYATVPDASVPVGEYRLAADFVASSSISAGQQYALSVGRTDTSWHIRYRTGDVCPGGNFVSNIGGPWAPFPPFGGDQLHDWVISVFVDPANEFSIGKPKGRRVSVNVPGPGVVDARDAGAPGPATARSAGSKLLKPSSATATAAGTVTLTVRLTKRAKRKLADTGLLKARAAISFTPTGGTARTQTVRLKIKKKR